MSNRLAAAGGRYITSADVRQRGGSMCVADVAVTNSTGDEIAVASVTDKLNR